MAIALEAKDTNLSALLKFIEHGDQVQLQQNGQAIATLSPLSTKRAEDSDAIDAAMQRIRDRAAATHQSFDWHEVKAWRDEGRS